VFVAFLASLGFLFADGEQAQHIALFVLAAIPAGTGLAIGRLRGHSWLTSVVVSFAALLAGLGIAVFKVAIGY
jgi:hypothetical protein